MQNSICNSLNKVSRRSGRGPGLPGKGANKGTHWPEPPRVLLLSRGNSTKGLLQGAVLPAFKSMSYIPSSRLLWRPPAVSPPWVMENCTYCWSDLSSELLNLFKKPLEFTSQEEVSSMGKGAVNQDVIYLSSTKPPLSHRLAWMCIFKI